jgi:hypothetical protein
MPGNTLDSGILKVCLTLSQIKWIGAALTSNIHTLCQHSVKQTNTLTHNVELCKTK